MNASYCSLTAEEFNHVSNCITAQEIWKILDITHEGTSQVKEVKLTMKVRKYENFKLKASESIQDMFTRFTNIVNKSKALGKENENEKLCRMILFSLSRDWEPKVTDIEEFIPIDDMFIITSYLVRMLCMNNNFI
ncbi:uncharacterized protein LOC109835291 [Asparagus officinalis]|uniref:uncharacterized protein LOC109835291 n=1 Tax=Asparagus officinalis TaxID=4686 RepID=UPI00098E449A|nr:uncharacterized protein LOC109835291 [Asparagus officinalis]